MPYITPIQRVNRRAGRAVSALALVLTLAAVPSLGAAQPQASVPTAPSAAARHAVAAAAPADRAAAPLAAPTPQPAGGSDLCLAIDDSGSMWNQTDQGPASDPPPNPLRAQAARVAISLLGADVNNPRDGVGVVLFGTASHAGDDIVVLPVTELSSNAAREGLYGRIASSMWSKGFTRIDRALESCLVLLQARASSAARIVLLTDGVPVSDDPRFNAAGQMDALGWTLDELRRRGWAVDVILLGPSASQMARDSGSFASRIASATGGQVYAAAQRTDLLRIYTQIVASMTGRSVVAGDPVNVARHTEVPISVEERTQTMTVTVVKSDPATVVHLLTPDRSELPQSEIVRTSTGLVETLTVREPRAGRWIVGLDGEGQAYVSLVLKALPALPVRATPAPRPTVAPAATAHGSSRRSLIVAGAVLAWLAGLAAAGSWARRRLVAQHVAGVAVITEAPGRVVSLEEIGGRYRRMGIVQQAVPLQAVVAALGREDSLPGELFVRGGSLMLRRPGREPGSTTLEPVEYGTGYDLPTTPPAELMFAPATDKLPRPAIVLSAPPSAGVDEAGDDALFEPAAAAAAPDESLDGNGPGEAAVDLVGAIPANDDRW